MFLLVSCLFAAAAATTDGGHHAGAHPAAHAVKDAGKMMVGSGVRGGGVAGSSPTTGVVKATALAALVLAALRYLPRDAGGQQCDTAATSSRSPPGRPVLA